MQSSNKRSAIAPHGQVQLHCSQDYSEAVPGNSPGEGPGAVWSAGQQRVVLQFNAQVNPHPALYASLVSLALYASPALYASLVSPALYASQSCTLR